MNKIFANNQEKYIFIVAIISQIADIITTYLALKQDGIYETVALSNCLISNGYFGQWALYKLLLVVGIYFVYLYTNQKVLLYFLLLLSIYVLYIAGHNVYITLY